MIRRPASTLRSAFTLIELMVVITIIGLLIAILLPAIQKVRVYGKRTQAGADIGQLTTAANGFKTEFKFYPPDSFVIPVKGSDAGVLIYQRMYPRWVPTVDASNVITPPLINAGLPMVGIQCLTYFTAGPDFKGWAIDGPYSPGGANKKGPFLEYSGPTLTDYKYTDPFGKLYVYFASGPGGSYAGSTSQTYDLVTVVPYKLGGKYVNSDSFQIISAGPNKFFGNNNVPANWTPGNADYLDTANGGDDIANFNGGTALAYTQ